jgi:hypothetical protein
MKFLPFALLAITAMMGADAQDEDQDQYQNQQSYCTASSDGSSAYPVAWWGSGSTYNSNSNKYNLKFDGCHTLTTSPTNGDSSQVYTASYVVLTHTSNSDGQNQNEDENENEDNNNNNNNNNQKVGMPIETYLEMVASAKQEERQTLCSVCQAMVYYCLPTLPDYLGVSGYAYVNGQSMKWDAPWDYAVSQLNGRPDQSIYSFIHFLTESILSLSFCFFLVYGARKHGRLLRRSKCSQLSKMFFECLLQQQR